jgi:hypothetical protein
VSATGVVTGVVVVVGVTSSRWGLGRLILILLLVFMLEHPPVIRRA